MREPPDIITSQKKKSKRTDIAYKSETLKHPKEQRGFGHDAFRVNVADKTEILVWLDFSLQL